MAQNATAAQRLPRSANSLVSAARANDVRTRHALRQPCTRTKHQLATHNGRSDKDQQPLARAERLPRSVRLCRASFLLDAIMYSLPMVLGDYQTSSQAFRCIHPPWTLTAKRRRSAHISQRLSQTALTLARVAWPVKDGYRTLGPPAYHLCLLAATASAAACCQSTRCLLCIGHRSHQREELTFEKGLVHAVRRQVYRKVTSVR